jgi:hypothetical protein
VELLPQHQNRVLSHHRAHLLTLHSAPW